ncbi:MAG TPA: hypothetical protein VJU83_08255 [Burkholderiales bacterium]|nr:hypothetical protein [Burkholderiales bacterium]
MKFRHRFFLALLTVPLVLQPAYADRGDRGGGGGRGNHGASRSFDGGGQRAQVQRESAPRRAEAIVRSVERGSFSGGQREQAQRDSTPRRVEAIVRSIERGSSGGVPSTSPSRNEWRDRSGGNDGWRQRPDRNNNERRPVGRVETPVMPGGMATGSFPPQQRDNNAGHEQRRWQNRIDGPKVPGVASHPQATVNPQRGGDWRDANNRHREHGNEGQRDGQRGDRNGSDHDRRNWDNNGRDWNKDRRDNDRRGNDRHNWNRHHNFNHHGPSRWHSTWHGHHGWHDIRRFRHNHFDGWRRGYWHHGHHGSRFGWWWVVGPAFYFYSGPVYPYPDPYIPPAVVVESVPIMQSEDTDPAYYYFCENPEGYYPYVQECATEWIPVPFEPEDAPYG